MFLVAILSFPTFRGFRYPGNFCLWNPESWKLLFVESWIRLENFTCGIQNPWLWNPWYTSRNPGTLTIGIQNPEIDSFEYRIQDCLGFTHTWGDFFGTISSQLSHLRFNYKSRNLSKKSKQKLDSSSWSEYLWYVQLQFSLKENTVYCRLKLKPLAYTEF